VLLTPSFIKEWAIHSFFTRTPRYRWKRRSKR